MLLQQLNAALTAHPDYRPHFGLFLRGLDGRITWPDRTRHQTVRDELFMQIGLRFAR